MSESVVNHHELFLPPTQVKIVGSSQTAADGSLDLNIELGENQPDIVLYDQPQQGSYVYYDAFSGDLVGLTMRNPIGMIDFYTSLLGSNFLSNLYSARGEPFIHQVPIGEQALVTKNRQQLFRDLQIRHLQAPIYGLSAGLLLGGATTLAD